MITIRQSLIATERHLSDVLGKDEGRGAARIIFEDVAGYTPTFIFANGDREMSDFIQARIDDVIARIVSGEPVQYAIGKAMFMGNMYEVNSSVLIPRPETVGLVDMVVSDYSDRADLQVLDIGTGSGCIAISLSKALKFSNVTGIDINESSLDVARNNAKSLHSKVNFEHLDILSASVPQEPLYDIIISNPPYICQSEENDMDSRVTQYEPSIALFVPDDDPMQFYRPIAHYAFAALKDGGKIYLEINQKYPRETVETLQKAGFQQAEAIRDYRGNYRYVTAIKKLDK